MSTAIQCNFARCAIQQFVSKHYTKHRTVPYGTIPKVVREYNDHFASESNMQVKYATASKHFPVVAKRFNEKWHPQEMRSVFLRTFSIEAWKALSPEERGKHSLSSCKGCCEDHPCLSSAFPRSVKRGMLKPKKIIALTKRDLSSPAALGGRVLKELSTISTQLFNKTSQEVLVETPRSNLIEQPSVKESKKQRKVIEKEIKSRLTEEKSEIASSMVLENRMSWGMYDRIRKSEGMTTPTRPQAKRKRRYNQLPEALEANKENLLQVAKSWPPEKDINWSKLAREYGLAVPNGGQIVKELLAEHDIPAALINLRPTRAKRRCLKRIGSSGVTFPMFPTVKQERQKVSNKIQNQEIDIGEKVVPSSYKNFTVNSQTLQVQENTVLFTARKISLISIRKKLLERHESLGIVRYSSDEYFDNLSATEIDCLSKKFGTSSLRQLKNVCRMRHIKVWHDHSSIAAHGYLLVLVSVLYDPAFFYTTEEMKSLKGIDIDVPALLDQAEIHILGRSSSSTEDQLMFVETRRNSLKDIQESLYTSNGVEVVDVIRFFYGDGPAAQFEAGHKQGGRYCCVGCGADSTRFSDIAYSYRSPKPSLKERQEFVLQGKSWKNGGEKSSSAVASYLLYCTYIQCRQLACA